MVDHLLTIQDVADFLKLDARTVRRLVKTDPEFPHPFLITEREKRWRPEEVQFWARLRELKTRLAEAAAEKISRTGRDREGQGGTSAPPTDLPARRRPNGK